LEPTTHWRPVGRLLEGDPRRVAGFEVLGRLGAGGMGVVYLADHPDRGRAALKFVRDGAGDASFRERFRREVAAVERVRSPRVAPVLAADPDAATPWLATAFVDGPTVAEAVDGTTPMAGDRLVALAVALADALAAIHAAGVVHRDLKPGNILLTPETPVVIDFGIAALRDAPALTRTGMSVGTPGWMAPEQVRGQACGPPADVFAWGLVVAFAASGQPAFGRGPADALFYRVVHEAPDLPALPPPLDGLVREALTKDSAARPDVARLLAVLAGPVLEPAAAGATAIGPTLADRTAVVPTIVARGWGVEAIPARPPGGPGFWFAGEEHHDARSLAAALQGAWDEAVDQAFRRRDPVWLGELGAFLQARGLDEADRLAADGPGADPPAACLARLLLALDPHLDPRVGSLWLTPEGLEAAGRSVAGGGPGGARLDEVAAARILRLWRSLSGMQRAATIDEQWLAATGAFTRHVAEVAPHAGLPSAAETRRASATLLLCAVHPDHERRLQRRLAAARRTRARHQPWWANLATDGRRDPAAAVLAVMTAERARAQSEEERRAARAAGSPGAAAGASRRAPGTPPAAARPAPARPLPPPPPPPPSPMYVPLLRARTSVHRTWTLVAALAGLVAYLWTVGTFGDALLAHYRTLEAGVDQIEAYRSASGSVGLAVLLIVVLPAAHVGTRKLVRQGASRSIVRAAAGGAAVLDILLGIVFLQAAALGVMVVGAALETGLSPGEPQAFGADQPWLLAGFLVPLGLVGVLLAVRGSWRFGRALFGRRVADVTGPGSRPLAVAA
jgi:predicted Ser/Thr protein kinase